MTVGKSGGHFESKKRWIRMIFEFYQSTATKKAVDCAVKNGSQPWSFVHIQTFKILKRNKYRTPPFFVIFHVSSHCRNCRQLL
jgi:hypothetical protein